MAEPETPVPSPEGAGSPWGSVVGVLFDPVKTLAGLRERPNVFVPYLVLMVASVVTVWLVANKTTAMMMQAMQAAGQVPPGMPAGVGTFMTVVAVVVGALLPWIMGVVFAGLLALVGVFAGGEARFKQLMSLVGYTYIPAMVIGGLLKAVLMVIKPVSSLQDLMTSPTSAAIFLPKEQFGTFLYRVALLLDPFALWSLGLLVVGYAAVNRFNTGKAAALIIPIWLLVSLLFVAKGAPKMPGLPS